MIKLKMMTKARIKDNTIKRQNMSGDKIKVVKEEDRGRSCDWTQGCRAPADKKMTEDEIFSYLSGGIEWFKGTKEEEEEIKSEFAQLKTEMYLAQLQERDLAFTGDSDAEIERVGEAQAWKNYCQTVESDDDEVFQESLRMRKEAFAKRGKAPVQLPPNSKEYAGVIRSRHAGDYIMRNVLDGTKDMKHGVSVITVKEEPKPQRSKREDKRERRKGLCKSNFDYGLDGKKIEKKEVSIDEKIKPMMENINERRQKLEEVSRSSSELQILEEPTIPTKEKDKDVLTRLFAEVGLKVYGVAVLRRKRGIAYSVSFETELPTNWQDYDEVQKMLTDLDLSGWMVYGLREMAAIIPTGQIHRWQVLVELLKVAEEQKEEQMVDQLLMEDPQRIIRGEDCVSSEEEVVEVVEHPLVVCEQAKATVVESLPPPEVAENVEVKTSSLPEVVETIKKEVDEPKSDEVKPPLPSGVVEVVKEEADGPGCDEITAFVSDSEEQPKKKLSLMAKRRQILKTKPDHIIDSPKFGKITIKEWFKLKKTKKADEKIESKEEVDSTPSREVVREEAAEKEPVKMFKDDSIPKQINGTLSERVNHLVKVEKNKDKVVGQRTWAPGKGIIKTQTFSETLANGLEKSKQIFVWTPEEPVVRQPPPKKKVVAKCPIKGFPVQRWKTYVTEGKTEEEVKQIAKQAFALIVKSQVMYLRFRWKAAKCRGINRWLTNVNDLLKAFCSNDIEDWWQSYMIWNKQAMEEMPSNLNDETRVWSQRKNINNDEE